MKNKYLNPQSLLVLAFIGIVFGFTLVIGKYDSQKQKEIPVVVTAEEQAQVAWMKGCVPHLMEETQKFTDVVNEQAATSKAQIYCQCEWDYMSSKMGLSLDEIATMQEEGSVGFKAIAEAQDYCYEKHKGDYYP